MELNFLICQQLKNLLIIVLHNTISEKDVTDEKTYTVCGEDHTIYMHLNTHQIEVIFIPLLFYLRR